MGKSDSVYPKNERINRLDTSLKIFFMNAVRVAIRNPGQVFTFLRTIIWLMRSARLRANWMRRGIRVPPIILFSVTYQCNLECKGCYARSFHKPSDQELTGDELGRIIAEASELGVSFFVLTGGEPLMRPEIFQITEKFPEMIFILFTNGSLIENETIDKFKKQKNIIPLLSLEGDPEDTDQRRGEGTHTHVESVMGDLKKEGVFFGTSITLTNFNFETVLNDAYIQAFINRGCKFLLFLDYTPTQAGTEDWSLTEEQKDRVPSIMEDYRKKFRALFIAVPWDEESVGGCLSSGRGFIHINAQGAVEPCPFAPYSDANLREVSLKEALKSKLLESIREMPELSKYTGSGCALWKNRDKVESLLGNERKKAK